MRIKEIISKREWYIQGFNAVPLLLYFGPKGGADYMWKSGTGYEIIINSYNNGYCEMYYPKDSLKKIYDEIMENPLIVEERIKISREEWKIVINEVERLRKINFSELSDHELENEFYEYCRLVPFMAAADHFVEGFTLNSDNEIKHMLEEFTNLSGKKLADYMTKMTLPDEPSFITKSEIMLSRMREKHEKGIDIEKDIEDYREKFYWIRTSYSESEELTKDYIIERIKNAKPVIDYEKNKDYSNMPHKLKIMLKITSRLAKFQDDRKMEILKSVYIMDKFAREISKRRKINVNLIRYILPIDKVFEIKEETLKKRVNGFTHIVEREKEWALEYSVKREMQKSSMVKEITGLSASSGKAIGKVQICKTMEDIRNFKEGNVLVTKMTRPEFLPAMKKASAIITDEGGITSHAAIVSRELGIPCIIGTKNATEILKNGDLIEVKANHGVVIIY